MKVQMGCGTELFPAGWVNIDPRPIGTDTDGVDVRRGDALHTGLEDNSVELLFSNAVFEHIYAAQHPLALREWRRVLAPDGLIVTIGIPDFSEVCRQYLAGGQGICGPRFDLYEAYRYVMGCPEGHLVGFDWAKWNPTERMNEAPDTYLLQIHKAVFDADYLARLLAYAGLRGVVFRYAYRDEPHLLNLAFLAGRRRPTIGQLYDVPFIDEFVNFETLEVVTSFKQSAMAAFVAQV